MGEDVRWRGRGLGFFRTAKLTISLIEFTAAMHRKGPSPSWMHSTFQDTGEFPPAVHVVAYLLLPALV